MAEGFRRDVASPQISEAVSSSVNRELTEGETDPYDTHPPLRERVAALQNWPEGAMPEHDSPAISLLNNIVDFEIRLVGSIANASTAQTLKPLAWDKVGQKIWVPAWEVYTQKYSRSLAGITPCIFPELSQDLDVLSRRLGAFDGDDLPPEERRRQASILLGTALAVALNRQGWELRALPGDDVVCEHKGTLIKPFDIVPMLASGALTPEAWRDLCASSGIADLDLSAGAAVAQAASSNQ
jgi:heat shock protein HtpX